MRELLKKLLAILDGTPTSRSPKARRGQSMVELTLTAPIFLIMIIGLAEVGWLANNYLVISDAVQTAGRYGSIRDPLEIARFHPRDVFVLNRYDCDLNRPLAGGGIDNSAELTFNLYNGENNTTPIRPEGLGFTIGAETLEFGFYDGVACQAVVSMEPLRMNRAVDDVVVSVFSYASLPNCQQNGANLGPCVRIVGRFPSMMNECVDDLFDPFDINRNGVLDLDEDGTNPNIIHEGWRWGDNLDETYFDTATDERFRGFSLLGNAGTPECIGSDFSLHDMEARLERTVTKINREVDITDLERSYVPNFGLVLVEITWHSRPILGFPLFDIAIPADGIPIYIWGVFPVSSVEPDIQ